MSQDKPVKPREFKLIVNQWSTNVLPWAEFNRLTTGERIHVIEYDAYDKLLKQNQILRDALEFYATKNDLWFGHCDDMSDDLTSLKIDAGNTANKALAEAEKLK